VLALQATHVQDRETRHLKIPGFNIIDYRGHHKYRLSPYVNQKIEKTNMVPIPENEHSIGTHIEKSHNLQRIQTTPEKVV